MTEIRRYADAQSLAQASAEWVIQVANESISEFGRFRIALSGGSTPKAMHKILASEPLKGQVDWSKVKIYWGDERSAPPDDERSNYRMAMETLLNHIPIPSENIHRIEGEFEPEEAATRYGRMLKAIGEPLDLILLGMGGDGHTASLFPHTEALNEDKHRCVANYVQKMDTWRITMTANPMINQARLIVFLVSGEGKAEVLDKVLNGPYQPEVYPSQLIKPVNGKVLWLVDEPAAKHL